jgi:hypothetical protein
LQKKLNGIIQNESNQSDAAQGGQRVKKEKIFASQN